MSNLIRYMEILLDTPKRYHNTSKGLQASWNCPMCGEQRGRFFVNFDRKVVWCHKCEYGASIITFISDFNGLSWRDALLKFREFDGYETRLPQSLEEEIYSKFLTVTVEQEKHIFPLPDEYVSFEHFDRRGTQAFKYLTGRGLSADDMILYRIGYCTSGLYADRIIMPDFEDGRLIYWQARTWLPEPTLKIAKDLYKKVLNPHLSQEQINSGVISIDKSEVISNIDAIRKTHVAVICEGKMDSYTIGECGGCLHGKHLSDTQLSKLINYKRDIHDIFIMLDNDAYDKAILMAERLDRYFPGHIYVCKLPEGQDPNSIGKKGCLQAIENATLYTPFFNIRSRLGGG